MLLFLVTVIIMIVRIIIVFILVFGLFKLLVPAPVLRTRLELKNFHVFLQRLENECFF